MCKNIWGGSFDPVYFRLENPDPSYLGYGIPEKIDRIRSAC